MCLSATPRPHPRATLFPYTTLFRSAAEPRDNAASPSFDMRKFLHAGMNTIAVLIKSSENFGGLINGVSVQMRDEPIPADWQRSRSEEHTSELQSRFDLVCRLLLEKK